MGSRLGHVGAMKSRLEAASLLDADPGLEPEPVKGLGVTEFRVKRPTPGAHSQCQTLLEGHKSR